MPWYKLVLRIAIALPLVGAGLSQQPGRGPGEANIDSAAVARGNQVYRPNCGFCHGLDARGAAGPDLARSLVILEDKGGKALSAFLKNGRPDLGMPGVETWPDPYAAEHGGGMPWQPVRQTSFRGSARRISGRLQSGNGPPTLAHVLRSRHE
jgi:mono/diheme cytochrome c family protein